MVGTRVKPCGRLDLGSFPSPLPARIGRHGLADVTDLVVIEREIEIGGAIVIPKVVAGDDEVGDHRRKDESCHGVSRSILIQ